jgi:hypothetical protein
MKVAIRPIFFALILLIFSSCIKLVYISKSSGPEIALNNPHNDIVFVNLFDYTSPEIVKEKEKSAYHEGVMRFIDGLFSFASDSSFSFTVSDTLKKGIGKDLLTTLLPVDTIQNICSRFNTNLLVALDSVSLYFDWEIVKDDNQYGYNGNTKNFYLNSKFYVSLYNSSGELINRTELDQSSLFASRPPLSGIVTFKPSISRAIYLAQSLGYYSGQDYVSRFYPHIIQDTQQLYTGKVFRESNSHIFEKNWAKAADLLEQLTKNQDPLIADKAKHNLDVVKEAAAAAQK